MSSNRLFHYTNLIQFQNTLNKDLLKKVFGKAEQIVISSESFDIKTVNSLIFLINSEIRDDMKPDFVFNVIMILYKSPLFALKLTKKTDSDRVNFDLFMENGLKYYIRIVDKQDMGFYGFWRNCRNRIDTCFRSPILNLRDLVNQLKSETTSSNLTLPSPMEGDQGKMPEDVQEQQILPYLPGDSETVDSSRDGSYFVTGAIQEKL